MHKQCALYSPVGGSSMPHLHPAAAKQPLWTPAAAAPAASKPGVCACGHTDCSTCAAEQAVLSATCTSQPTCAQQAATGMGQRIPSAGAAGRREVCLQAWLGVQHCCGRRCPRGNPPPLHTAAPSAASPAPGWGAHPQAVLLLPQGLPLFLLLLLRWWCLPPRLGAVWSAHHGASRYRFAQLVHPWAGRVLPLLG